MATSTEVERRVRIVAALVLAAIVLAIVTIVGVCTSADRSEAAAERRFVATGVAHRIKEMEQALNPYLIWDEALINTDTRYAPDWVEQNLASVSRDGVRARMFILDGRNEPLHASPVAKEASLARTYAPYREAIAALVADVRAEERRPDRAKSSVGVHRSAVVEIDGRPEFITVGLIEPDGDARAKGPGAPLIVAAGPLEPAFTVPLEARYFLEDLRIVRGPSEGAAFQLAAVGAAPVSLAWSPRRPGAAVLVILLPIMLVVAALLLMGAWSALRGIRAESLAAAASEARAVGFAREADTANEAKSAFLSNMSHELRTPLTSIVGFAGLLARSGDALPEDARRQIGHMLTGSESLLVVINDILDFSKLEAGAVELDPTPCRIAEAISGAVLLLTPQAQAKGLALSVEGLSLLPDWALVDGGRLRQVILNLVGNAVKFTAEGSVRVIVAPGDEGRWRIDVVDTGPGIPADVVPRLFGRFQQAEMSTSRHFGGTGLGLAISRALVELMGGRIEVLSTPGRGSTFRIEMDLPAAAAPEAHPVGADIAEVGPATILVVDDTAVNRELLVAILGALGLEVVTAPSGQAALELTATRVFDLILMDVQMPGMDGLTCTRALRAAGATMPILALTANVGQDQVEACLSAGMDGHLAKPISIPDMTAALAAALSGPETRGGPSATPAVHRTAG